MGIFNELEITFNKAMYDDKKHRENLAAKNRYNGLAPKKGFRRIKTKSGTYVLKRMPLKTTVFRVLNKSAI